MTTPAGWYRDPSNDNQQRYWDGERWSDHVAPITPSADAGTAGAAGSGSAGFGTTTASTTSTGEATATSSSSDGAKGAGRILGGVAAAVLVLVAGVFAYGQLAGADGGADSPEAAVSALMDAVGDEDLVGVAEALLPGDRRAYVDPGLESIDHLRRWGVLADDLDTSDVGGFDLEVEDLELRADQVSDDVANVYASGTIRARVEGETLPIGDLVEERAMQDVDRSELDGEDEEVAPFRDVMITTVEEDGRWYVSFTYTIAEHARADAGLPIPSPADAVEPIGASSPAEAVDEMLVAMADLDIEEIVARLHPDDVGAVQRYGALFLPDAEAAIADMKAESGLEMRIEDVDYEIVERDGLAVVQFGTSYRVWATADGEEFEAEYADGCTTITIDGESEETCEEEGSAAVPGVDWDDAPVNLEAIFEDMDETGLVLAQHDGEWYVSPARTMSETFLAIMRAIDRDELESVIDAIGDGSLAAWFEAEMDSLFELGGIDPFGATAIPVTPGSPPTTTIDTIARPDDYGSDPELDALWDACEDGDGEACDDLYLQSPIGSEYERFGRSCGDRESDTFAVFCTEAMAEDSNG